VRADLRRAGFHLTGAIMSANGEIVLKTLVRRVPTGQNVRFVQVVRVGEVLWTCDRKQFVCARSTPYALSATPDDRWDVVED
jgi:hypothetical protein